MSRTKREIPSKKLTPKQKKLAKKGKYHHGLIDKVDYELHYSPSHKKEAKKEKHRKQRIQSKKEIEEVKTDE